MSRSLLFSLFTLLPLWVGCQRLVDNPNPPPWLSDDGGSNGSSSGDGSTLSPDGSNSNGGTNTSNATSSNGPDGSSPECQSPDDCNGLLCDTDAGRCVECLDDEPCTDAPNLHCSGDGSCVACTSADHCGYLAPVCSNNSCATCETGDDCQRFDNAPFCANSGRCVACIDREQCTTETAPRCAANGSCTTCNADGDCTRFGKVCDDATHQCVQCRPNTEDTDCDGFSCNPTSRACTQTKLKGLGGCGKPLDSADEREIVQCISDSECADGNRCVATEFKDAPHGTFCLPIAPDDPNPCPNQVAAKRTATSRGGIEDDYCFPNDVFTTCEGIIDFKNSCPLGTNEECGASGLDDGRCESFKCTYRCNADEDCDGVNCIGNLGDKFCDPN